MTSAVLGRSNFMAALSEYRTYMTRRGFSPRTIDQREAFARARLREWGTWDQHPDRIADFLARFTGHTKRTYYDHFAALYAWLTQTGRVEADPMSEVRRPPTPKPRPRPLTSDDARRALLQASGDLRASAWTTRRSATRSTL